MKTLWHGGKQQVSNRNKDNSIMTYNIGDEVWAFFNGEPTAGKITKTGAVIEGYFEYKGKVYKFRRVAEGVHFPRTKEELLKSL